MARRRTTDPLDQLREQFGEGVDANLTALADIYKQVVDRLDCRALMNWKICEPLEDLVGPIVLHTMIVCGREMRLGELRGLLDVHGGDAIQAAYRRGWDECAAAMRAAVGGNDER